MKQQTGISITMTAFFMLFMLSSCLGTQAAHPVAALLEQPSEESRRILEIAIGNLMNSQAVTLADNVFTTKSTVIIEANQPKDSSGKLLDGRDIRAADTFSLLTENGKCYVKHDQSGLIKLLGTISCRAK